MRRPRLKPRRTLPGLYSVSSWTEGVLQGALIGACMAAGFGALLLGAR